MCSISFLSLQSLQYSLLPVFFIQYRNLSSKSPNWFLLYWQGTFFCHLLTLSLFILLPFLPLYLTLSTQSLPSSFPQSPRLYFNYLSLVLPKTLGPSTRTGCCFVCALMATKLAKCCQYPFATFLANNTKSNNVAATTFSLPASVQLSAEREFTPKAQGVIVLSRF